MQITGLGHASVFIETRFGSVLTDPWVNPAYFGSWFPFPDNSQLDWDRFGQADYLFVSHLHRDHFDPEHLSRHISKQARVLLPAYATSELEDCLRQLGFRHFVTTVSEQVQDLDGLQVMIQSLTSPTDGPIGDSSLWLSDGEATVLNQNDARPTDLSVFAALGPVDAHLLQFSGAIWFPMVYDLPLKAKQALGRTKRDRQFDRTLRYMDDLAASYVFPIAGPPCFLDEQLWDLNDINGDDSNIFPDQQVFLDWLTAQGRANGRLLLPATVNDLAVAGCPSRHPIADVEVSALFADKVPYLRDMQARRMPQVEQAKLGWPHPDIDVLASVTEWFTPLLEQADQMAAGINGCVRFTAVDSARGDVDFVLDFIARQVRPYAGEKVRYRFQTERAYVEQLIADHEIDWVNSLFLSCRFTATRVGQYNEYVYTFFKCLSEERLNYAEGWYAESADNDEMIVLDGWTVQRRCPHLKADLTKFGTVSGDVLTCQMHGWQWDLADGRCISSVGEPLRTEGRAAPAGLQT